MSSLNVSKVAGGERNVTLHITGILKGEPLPPTPIDLKDKQLKLSSLAWLIQEKLGIYLAWNEEIELLPMESRNTVRFDTSLRSPANWDGRIWISSFNSSGDKQVFFIILDFDR